MRLRWIVLLVLAALPACRRQEAAETAAAAEAVASTASRRPHAGRVARARSGSQRSVIEEPPGRPPA